MGEGRWCAGPDQAPHVHVRRLARRSRRADLDGSGMVAARPGDSRGAPPRGGLRAEGGGGREGQADRRGPRGAARLRHRFRLGVAARAWRSPSHLPHGRGWKAHHPSLPRRSPDADGRRPAHLAGAAPRRHRPRAPRPAARPGAGGGAEGGADRRRRALVGYVPRARRIPRLVRRRWCCSAAPRC